MSKLNQFLINRSACNEALKWLGERNTEQAWVECPRGDWMLWLVERVVYGDDLKRDFVRISLDCAKLSLPATSDPRAYDCCSAIERWLAGETVDLRVVCKHAWAAAESTEQYAARSAAWAVESAARYAAWSPSIWVAAATRAAVQSSCSAAESAARSAMVQSPAESVRNLECADIVRKYIPWVVIRPLIEWETNSLKV